MAQKSLIKLYWPITKGAFHLSELAGRTMAGLVRLKMKYAFSKSFCWKRSPS